jgi:hypothetical protein
VTTRASRILHPGPLVGPAGSLSSSTNLASHSRLGLDTTYMSKRQTVFLNPRNAPASSQYARAAVVSTLSKSKENDFHKCSREIPRKQLMLKPEVLSTCNVLADHVTSTLESSTHVSPFILKSFHDLEVDSIRTSLQTNCRKLDHKIKFSLFHLFQEFQT